MANVFRQEQLQVHGPFASMRLDRGGVHVQHLKLWHMLCTCKASDFTVSGFLALALCVFVCDPCHFVVGIGSQLLPACLCC